ncbi:MAG: sulfatase-like hydrolase/transferase, partial [Candidatus Latescibacteria bacterium]|nr:sulfatase-like hydrolase/transferase [Candidatus Latescibacterota bacterium]
ICMPSRSSMITGRSQRGHQVFNHNVNLSEAIPVLGDGLRDVGYATALIGKAHFKTADIEDVLPDQPPEGAPIDEQDGLWHGPYYGFDYIDIHTGHAYSAGHWRIWLEQNHPDKAHLWRREHALSDIDAFDSWKNALPAELHYTQWTADRTVDWLQERDVDRPFFLWMSFADPHKPFAPPEPYCDMYADADLPDAVPPEDASNKPPHYQWARDGKPYGGYNTLSEWDGDKFQEIVAHYYGLTTFIDDAMGQVFEELDRQGLWENTHVVFTSDHGEGLKDHGIAAKPMMSYECVNRVPFFWRHPSVSAGTFDGVMTHLDLTPTFLDLAEAAPLPGMEGRSFGALLQGQATEHRDAVIVERISVIGAEVMKVKMLVTEDWKLLHYGSADYGELYDVKNDPEDIHNLWDDAGYADVRRRLTDRLLAELIDGELGDPAVILRGQSVAGALRDQRGMEIQPEARSSLEDQRLGNTKRRAR